MESYIADVKQLFNVKSIASAVEVDKMVDGQFGIFAEGSTTSIADNTTFANLPDRMYIVSKLNGVTYYSAATIDKATLRNKVAQAYQAEVVNTWEVVVQHCKNMDYIRLYVNLDETKLEMRDGITWTHRDIFVEVSNKEMKCAVINGEIDEVYENNVMTKLLVEKINLQKSEFYFAKAVQLDGTVITDIDAFITSNNTANGETPAPKALIKFVLEGKPQPAKPYRDLDINYTYPRGVRLKPAIATFSTSQFGQTIEENIPMTETQVLVFEKNAGADLRAEEFDNMSNYTTLNYQNQLCDGIAVPELTYQFENGVNYNVVNFEFFADKVESNSGRKRLFGVLLATSVTATFNKLKTMFGVA